MSIRRGAARAPSAKFVRAATFAVGALLCLGSLGCASGGSGGGRGTAVGDRPDGTVLRDLRGGVDDVGTHRGVVQVVNLWATWCPPCRAELPLLQRVAATPGVRVVGIDQGEDRSRVVALARRLGLTYPLYLDPEQYYGARYATIGLPTTVIVGPDGRIARIRQGAYDDVAALRRDVEAARR